MPRRAEARYAITAEDKSARAFSSFERRLKNLRGLATKIGGVIAGALGVRALWSGMRRTAEETDNIAKAARRAGVSVEFMSRLAHESELAGADLATLERAMVRLNAETGDIGGRTKKAEAAFRALGLNMAEFFGADTATRFALVAHQIAQVQNVAQKTDLAEALFGRAGRQLMPLFETVGQDLEGIGARAERAGAAIGQRAAAEAEQFIDQLTEVDAQIKNIHRSLLAIANDNNLGEGLTNIAKLMGMIAGGVLELGGGIGRGAGAAAESVRQNPGTFYRLFKQGGRVTSALGQATGITAGADKVLRELQKQNRNLERLVSMQERDGAGGGANFM